MLTVQEYIDQLKVDKQNLVDNLLAKGITATSDETFTSLVPKVLDIVIVNNQSKSETITTNTTTTITPDNGYTGLSSVEITTNVQPNLQSKSETITTNTTTTISADEGYDGLSSVSVTTNISADISRYFASSLNKNDFNQCHGYWIVKEVPDFELNSSVTSLSYTFQSWTELITIGYFDTKNVTNFQGLFNQCNKLANVPLYDLSAATVLQSMFGQCFALSATSLDNILQMCIGATSYTGTKTLYYLGITSSSHYPVATIQALPHYQDFIDAGWTIGY